MKTKLFATIVALGVFVSCSNVKKQEVKADPFEVAVTQLLEGFKAKDAEKVNALINQKVGLDVLHRPGAIDAIANIEKIDFANVSPTGSEYPMVDTIVSVKYEVLPIYSCEEEPTAWNKGMGLYCDTANVDKKVSSMVRFFLDNEMAEDRNVTEETFQNYLDRENNSRRVVAINSKGDALVFYMTEIEGQWYFTILDRVSDYCGA